MIVYTKKPKGSSSQGLPPELLLLSHHDGELEIVAPG